MVLTLSQTSLAKNFKNEALKEGEGLRFQEIGELKLITRQFPLSFKINLTDIELLMDATQKLLNESKEKFHEDAEFMNQTEALENYLITQQNVYGEIFQNVVRSPKRVKRGVFDFIENLFFPGDVAERDKSIQEYHKTLNDLIVKVNESANTFNSSVSAQNESYYKMLKQKIIQQVELEINSVDECLRSLEMLQQRKKLSDVFVKFSSFKKALEGTETKKRSDEAMPYDDINQYFYNLEAFHQIDGSGFYLTVHVPLIEEIPRKLYNVYEIPSYNNGKLMITDVQWKYIAVGESDMVMFKDLKHCLNGVREGLIYCEIQSQIESLESNSSCLVKAYNNGTIDSDLCKTSGAQISQLTFIQLEDGQFFYYTPEINKTTLQIICDSETQNEILQYYTGILTLDKMCKAKSSVFELISTKTFYHEVNYLSLSIIMYSEGEMEKTFEKIISKFEDHSKAFNDLLEFRKEIEDVENSELQIQTGGMELDMMVVFASTAVLIFCLIVFRSIFVKYCSKEKSYMNKRKQDSILKLLNEQPSTSKKKA